MAAGTLWNPTFRPHSRLEGRNLALGSQKGHPIFLRPLYPTANATNRSICHGRVRLQTQSDPVDEVSSTHNSVRSDAAGSCVL